MEISIRNRWISRLHEESNKNSKSLYKNGCLYGTYVTTVFLLDTSASMAGEGLEQMKTAFKDIINEFSKHPSITEYVSVITFGDDVKILQYYSKDYISISKCVDTIQCKGNSKLEAGLIMCMSGIQTVPYSKIGSFHVRTRIVVITDGKPTDLCNENGHEIYQSRGYDEVSDAVINMAKQLGRGNPIFCIPVGTDPDICFLGTMVLASDGGKIIPFTEAEQFGRYAINLELASKVLNRIPEEDQFSRETIKSEIRRIKKVSEKDLDDVCEIIENRDAYKSGVALIEEGVIELEKEYEERDAKMPCVGTRVRRGPDWKWKNQDGHGIGTVVGHSKRVGWINVEWDTGLQLPYRYGNIGLQTAYDIEPCNEPRILEDHPIAVGCLVRRGQDWKWDDQDGGKGNVGTVYRLKTPTEVYVRWPNGNKSNYRYGYKNKFDVELCDPFDPSIKEMLRKRSLDAKATGPYATREKSTRHDEARFVSESVYSYNDSSSQGNFSSIVESIPMTSEDNMSNTSLVNKKKRRYFRNTSDLSTCKRWQWRSEDGKWNDFPKEANEIIDKNYTNAFGTSVVVRLNGQLCRVHFQKKRMVNTITKEATDIRVRESHDYNQK